MADKDERKLLQNKRGFMMTVRNKCGIFTYITKR